MNTDKQANKFPNFTRRIFWVFVGQAVVTACLFTFFWSFPTWFNWVIAAIAILFTPLAYLVLLKQPPVRAAWLYLFKDCIRFLAVITPEIIHLFSRQSVKQMVRAVIFLKKFPDTLDEWITFCVLPFKTCIIVTFPMIWIFEKIASFTSYYRPYGRTSGLSYELMFQCYLISLVALLFGALVQGVFCRAGRATTTLRFFLLGLILLIFLALASRAISL